MSSDPKVYGFEEIAKHNHKDDCWLLISGKVYDVTPFLDDHPGGDEILLMSVGKDATEDFEDIGHSEKARDMMKSYFVGVVDISTIPPKRKPPTAPQPSSSDRVTTIQPSQPSGSLVKLLLPILMFVLAFALTKYFKKQD